MARVEDVFKALLSTARRIKRYKIFTRCLTHDEDQRELLKLINKWFNTHTKAGNNNPTIKHAMEMHFHEFYAFSKRDDGAALLNYITRLDEYIKGLSQSTV